MSARLSVEVSPPGVQARRKRRSVLLTVPVQITDPAKRAPQISGRPGPRLIFGVPVLVNYLRSAWLLISPPPCFLCCERIEVGGCAVEHNGYDSAVRLDITIGFACHFQGSVSQLKFIDTVLP